MKIKVGTTWSKLCPERFKNNKDIFDRIISLLNEDIELSSAVTHGPKSVINQQVTNGVAVRMALLYLLAGGSQQ